MRVSMRVSSDSHPNSYFNYQYVTAAQAILREDDRRSVFKKCGFDDLPRMDGSSIDGAPKQHLQIADNAVARVEVETREDLTLKWCEFRL